MLELHIVRSKMNNDLTYTLKFIEKITIDSSTIGVDSKLIFYCIGHGSNEC